MARAHCIAVEESPRPEDMNAVVQGLMDFNRSRTDGAMPEYLVVSVRDEEGVPELGELNESIVGEIEVVQSFGDEG